MAGPGVAVVTVPASGEQFLIIRLAAGVGARLALMGRVDDHRAFGGHGIDRRPPVMLGQNVRAPGIAMGRQVHDPAAHMAMAGRLNAQAQPIPVDPVGIDTSGDQRRLITVGDVGILRECGNQLLGNVNVGGGR